MPATLLQTVLRLAGLFAGGLLPAGGGPLPADGGSFPAAGQHEHERGCEMGPLQALLPFCSVSHLSSRILFSQLVIHAGIHTLIHSFTCMLFSHSFGPSTCVGS